jgi:hypothetical protein
VHRVIELHGNFRPAASTKSCRIARAAIRLKCSLDVAAMSGDFASLIHASFTSAVGLSVALGSPRRTLDASRRNSSYVTLKR